MSAQRNLNTTVHSQTTLTVKFEVASTVLESLVKLYIHAGMVDRAESCVNQLVCFKCKSQQTNMSSSNPCCETHAPSKQQQQQQQYGPTAGVLNELLAGYLEETEYVKAHEIQEKFLRCYGVEADANYVEAINLGLSVPETESAQVKTSRSEEQSSFFGLS